MQRVIQVMHPRETSYSLIPSIASHSRFLTTHLITMNPTWGLYLGKKIYGGVENTKVKKRALEMVDTEAVGCLC